MYEHLDLRISHMEDRASLRLRPWKWLALVLSLLAASGTFFCYDNPQALHTYIIKDLKISEIDYNYFYSIYASPNIMMPFLAGLLIDKFGARTTIVIFSVIVTTGQFLLASAAARLDYKGMLVGRLVYSIGGDSLIVGISVLISRWFEHRATTFALSILYGAQSFCLSLNSFITPLLKQKHDLGYPLYFGGWTCVVSLIAAVGLWFLDREEAEREAETEGSGFNIADTFQWRDMRKIKGIFWVLLLTSGFIFASYYGFSNVANDYMGKRFHYDPQFSGRIYGVALLGAAILTPFVGNYIDKHGKRAVILSASVLCLLVGHMGFYLESGCNHCMTAPLPLIFFALFIAIYFAVIWSCLPIVVESEYLGTAYGLFYLMKGLMLSGIPVLVGYLQDVSPQLVGYDKVSLLLAILAAIGLAFSSLVVWIDFKTERLLNDSKDLSRRASLLSMRRERDSSDKVLYDHSL